MTPPDVGPAAAGHRRTVHALVGPALFLVCLALPAASMPYAVRGSLGLLLWMSWWWIFQPVHLAVTGLLPLAVLAVFDFLPVGRVLPAYAQELVILLLAANMLAAMWRRWGLDRRVALTSLIGVGTGTRRHLLVWFGVAAALSTFLPNTVVAATMMPIALAMLRFIDIEDVGKSAFGSALLIAIAWGTSVGGSGTPLGGAPNLIAVRLIEDQITSREFLFTTWVTRVFPLTLAVSAVAFGLMRFAFKPEISHVEGSRTYFARELEALGRLTGPERWGLCLFGGATLLAFTRQLYSNALPGLTPAFAFLIFAVVAFVVRHRGEPLLTWDYAHRHMVWGLIYLFAGGSALGQVLSETGTAQFVADRLIPWAGGGGFPAVVLFSLLTVVLTQVTSNTGAVAIIVPITISTFQSLGLNPLPYVYIVVAAGNCGFMLPSSAGGPAIAAGYGIDLKLMFSQGVWLTLLVWLAIVGPGYLLATYWAGFGVG